MGKKDKKNKADAAIGSVAESLGTLVTGDETAGKLIGAIAGPLLSAGLSSMVQPTDPQAKQKTMQKAKAAAANTQLQPGTTPYTLHLRVDSAQYLRFATSTKAFCKVYIGNTLLGVAGATGHREYTTRTCESANPAIAQWNQSLEIPVQHKQEVLSICVYSEHANSPCSCIGSCGVQLRNLMDRQPVQQDHTLRLGAEQAGTIRLHMTLTQSALHHAYSEPQMHMQAGIQHQQPGGYVPQAGAPSYSTPMNAMQSPPAHLVRLNVLSAQNSMLGSAFQAFCQLFVGNAAIGTGNDHRKFVVPHQALSGPNAVQWNHAIEIPLVHHNEVLSVCMYAKQAQGSPSVGTCVIGFNTPALSSGHLDDRSYSLLLGGKVVGEIRLLIQVITNGQHESTKAASCGPSAGGWAEPNGQPQQASWQAGCGGPPQQPQQQPYYPQQPQQQQAPIGNPMPPNQAQWQGQPPQQSQQQWQGQPPQYQPQPQQQQQQWQEPTKLSDSQQQQCQGPPSQPLTPQQQYPPAPEQAQWQQQSQAQPQTQQQYSRTDQPAPNPMQSQEQHHQQWCQQPVPGPEPAVVVVTPQEQIPPPQSSQWPQNPQGVGNQYEYPIATPLETKTATFEPRSNGNNDHVGSLSSDEEDSSSDQDEQDQSEEEAGYSSDEVDANREHKLLLRLEKIQLELQAIRARRQQRGRGGQSKSSKHRRSQRRHSGSKSSSRSHAAPSRDPAAELRAVSQANEELDAAFARAAIEQRGRNMALALI